MSGAELSRPLEGIRILDLSRILSGPYCTAIFADMGAEVIKLERPGNGDDTREFYPIKDGESGYYIAANRGKKGITVDLSSEKGKEIVHRLLEEADVLVENFRPGATKKLGLDYESLKDRYPKLVYASISGFGQNTSRSREPAYDIVIQAQCGLMELTGFPDGPPVKVGTSIIDITAGLYACIGILSALRSREFTGKGQHVDVSMLDVGLSILENAVPRCTMMDESPRRNGNASFFTAPFNAYQTKDGYIVLAAPNNKLWGQLCDIIGKPERTNIPELTTLADRMANSHLVEAVVSEWAAGLTNDEACRLLAEAKIPASPVRSVKEALADPYVAERGMLASVTHPTLGTVTIPNLPIQFSGTPSNAEVCSPGLGEHNREILSGMLGMSDSEMEQLSIEGVI
ncbi:CoA transferase [Oscillospiraceae bacterium OttesenSCG-928-G22]|nr:CoA transferase [Oscillospiraceae bacterium OttesenSCG-928-G22]